MVAVEGHDDSGVSAELQGTATYRTIHNWPRARRAGGSGSAAGAAWRRPRSSAAAARTCRRNASSWSPRCQPPWATVTRRPLNRGGASGRDDRHNNGTVTSSARPLGQPGAPDVRRSDWGPRVTLVRQRCCGRRPLRPRACGIDMYAMRRLLCRCRRKIAHARYDTKRFTVHVSYERLCDIRRDRQQQQQQQQLVIGYATARRRQRTRERDAVLHRRKQRHYSHGAAAVTSSHGRTRCARLTILLFANIPRGGYNIILLYIGMRSRSYRYIMYIDI